MSLPSLRNVLIINTRQLLRSNEPTALNIARFFVAALNPILLNHYYALPTCFAKKHDLRIRILT